MWLFAGFSAWLTEEVADGTDAFTLFFSLLPRCCVPPPHPPPVPCLAIRFLSVHQCRGRGEKRGGGGLFWSMAGNQTMGREDVKQIGPITYLPTRIPQSHLSLHLFLASFCVPICNTQKRTPTHTHVALWKNSQDTTHTNMHLTTNMLQKKKKHTAARSFRLICQHTYTHTHNRVNGLYLPVPYGNITNNIHNLNILYFQPYANLKHIAYFLQGPINSHTRACERHTNTHTNPSEDMCNQDRETEWLSGSTLLICGIFITVYCHHFYGGQHRCSLLEALISWISIWQLFNYAVLDPYRVMKPTLIIQWE